MPDIFHVASVSAHSVDGVLVPIPFEQFQIKTISQILPRHGVVMFMQNTILEARR